MWDYFNTRKFLDFIQPFDVSSSPFAFPRLPPKANPPLGIANAGKIKDSIVQDKDLMMNRLNSHHRMFQHYAAGLFNLTPNQFVPGHPMHTRMHVVDTLKEENEKLLQENSILKNSKNREKKN